jgi:hypothetical protein
VADMGVRRLYQKESREGERVENFAWRSRELKVNS